jgi:hypothetical protein
MMGSPSNHNGISIPSQWDLHPKPEGFPSPIFSLACFKVSPNHRPLLLVVDTFVLVISLPCVFEFVHCPPCFSLQHLADSLLLLAFAASAETLKQTMQQHVQSSAACQNAGRQGLSREAMGRRLVVFFFAWQT